MGYIGVHYRDYRGAYLEFRLWLIWDPNCPRTQIAGDQSINTKAPLFGYLYPRAPCELFVSLTEASKIIFMESWGLLLLNKLRRPIFKYWKVIAELPLQDRRLETHA